MAEQRHIECRMARRIGRQRRRWRACYLPAAACGAGHRFGSRAEQQCHHSALPGGKRQSARCGEVENGSFADRLDDHRANRAASRDVGPGPEGGNGIGRIDQEQHIRRDAEFGQSMTIWLSAEPGFRLPHPEYGSGPVGAPCDQQREGRGACGIGKLGGINFVQRGFGESPSKTQVQWLRAKSDRPGIDAVRPRAREAGAQQRLGRLYVHDLFYHASYGQGQYRDSKFGMVTAPRRSSHWRFRRLRTSSGGRSGSVAHEAHGPASPSAWRRWRRADGRARWHRR